MTENSNIEANITLSGEFGEIMNMFSDKKETGPLADYPKLEDPLERLLDIIKTLEKSQGMTKSELFLEAELEYGSIHKKSMLKFMRDVGILDLDGRTYSLVNAED